MHKRSKNSQPGPGLCSVHTRKLAGPHSLHPIGALVSALPSRRTFRVSRSGGTNGSALAARRYEPATSVRKRHFWGNADELSVVCVANVRCIDVRSFDVACIERDIVEDNERI